MSDWKDTLVEETQREKEESKGSGFGGFGRLLEQAKARAGAQGPSTAPSPTPPTSSPTVSTEPVPVPVPTATPTPDRYDTLSTGEQAAVPTKAWIEARTKGRELAGEIEKQNGAGFDFVEWAADTGGGIGDYFSDNIVRSARAYGNTLTSSPGMIRDIAVAAASGDPDEFFSTLANRGAPLLGNALHVMQIPLGVPGGVLTGETTIPGQATDTLDKWNTAYMAAVDKPLATALAYAALLDAESSEAGNFWHPQNAIDALSQVLTNPTEEIDRVQEAWDYVSGHNPTGERLTAGDMVVVDFATTDATNPEEIGALVNTWWFDVSAFTVNLVLELYLDFDVWAVGFFQGARAGTRAVGVAEDTITAAKKKANQETFFNTLTRTRHREAHKAAVDSLDEATSISVFPDLFEFLPAQAREGVLGFRTEEILAGNNRRIERVADSVRTARVERLFGSDLPPDQPTMRGMRKLWDTTRSTRRWMDEVDRIIDSSDDLDVAATRIVDELLNHQAGGRAHADDIASMLVLGKTREERNLTMRFLLGDSRAFKEMVSSEHDRLYGMAMRLADLKETRAAIRAQPNWFETIDIFGNPWSPYLHDKNTGRRIANIDREISGIMDDLAVRPNTESLYKAIQEPPRLTQRGNLRAQLKWKRGSQWYQNGRLSKPLRKVFDMDPHNIIRVDDSRVGDLTARALRQAGMPDAEIAKWRGQITRAQVDRRADIISSAFTAAERHIMTVRGFTEEEIEMVTRHALRGRSNAQNVIALNGKRLYAAEDPTTGRSLDELAAWLDEDTDEIVALHTPLMSTQLEHRLVVPDYKLMQHYADRVEKMKYGGVRVTAENIEAAVRKKPPRRLRGGDDLDEITDVAGEVQKLIDEDDFVDGEALAAKIAEVVDSGKMPSSEAIAKRLERRSGREITVSALDGLMSIWKTGVLLRPAWTVRVLSDEQLRMFGKFGVLARLTADSHGFRNYAWRMKKNPTVERIFALDKSTFNSGVRTGAMGAGVGALVGGVEGGVYGGIAGGFFGGVLNHVSNLDQLGYRNRVVGDWDLDGAMNRQNSELLRQSLSSRGPYNEFLNISEANLWTGMKRTPTSYKTHVWSDTLTAAERDAYQTEWVRSFKQHFKVDPMAKKLLGGESVDDVHKWLTATAEGAAHMARIPSRQWTPRIWVENLAQMIDDYTGHSGEIRRALADLSGAASDAQYKKIFKELPVKNPIHGAELSEVLGDSPFRESARNFVDSLFDVFGTSATDELSRIPAFKLFYDAEMARYFSDIPKGELPASTVKALEGRARRYALHETRILMYDLSENSEFGEMVRWLIPFFPAWQEVLTRWAGIAVENPLFVTRMIKVFQSPSVENGMLYRDAEGEERMRIPVPNMFVDLLNRFNGPLGPGGGLIHDGFVYVDHTSMNMIANGPPGLSPFGQVATSQVLYQKPEWYDNPVMEILLPYGPTRGGKLISEDSIRGSFEAFLPTHMRRELGRVLENDDRSYLVTFGQVTARKIYEAFEIGSPPASEWSDAEVREFFDEVRDETNAIYNIRIAAALFSPVSTEINALGPYQPIVDMYRALQARNPDAVESVAEQNEYNVGDIDVTDPDFDPQTAFTMLFGPTALWLVQSTTATKTGLGATIEGWVASEEYADLISEYGDDWSNVIAGIVGVFGEFNYAVYELQRSESTFPGELDPDRTPRDPAELLTAPEVSLGWDEYSALMDDVTNEMRSQGLPNLQVSEAEYIREFRKKKVAEIEEKYPAWAEARGQIGSPEEIQKKIEGAWVIATHPDFADDPFRPDIAGLQQWLVTRQTVIDELVWRSENMEGASTIGAKANHELALWWEDYQINLVESNPAFARLYYRYLELDVPAIDTGLDELGNRNFYEQKMEMIEQRRSEPQTLVEEMMTAQAQEMATTGGLTVGE